MSRLHTSPAADLLQGHTLRDGAHHCLFCEAHFEEGLVFPDADVLRTAPKAAAHHVATAHGGPFAALLALGKSGHGLSAVQSQVLELSARGLDDKAIAEALGGRAVSTVRNHRFQLRRRHREARLFCALMELLETGPAPPPETEEAPARFVDFHAELPTSDERTAVTEAEAAKLRRKYFKGPENIQLDRIPKKEKHKLVVLQAVVERLDHGTRYSEREMNERLAAVHADTAALRRYLVDYRFMARLPDGSAYWRIDGDR